MSSTTNIIPKDCSYQCGKRIYWSVADNAFLEVFTKQKHICPNRSNTTTAGSAATATNRTLPFYTKKYGVQRPKMANSLELLTGPFDSIQKKYEILSDIVIDLGGKCHGSQSHVNGNNICLVVYYEVPLGQRDEVKRKFSNS